MRPFAKEQKTALSTFLPGSDIVVERTSWGVKLTSSKDASQQVWLTNSEVAGVVLATDNKDTIESVEMVFG